MSNDPIKIGNTSLISGLIIIVLAVIFPALAFYLFVIPIILGLLALRRKDKLGYYGLVLGILAWLISWFVMSYVTDLLYQL